MKFNCAKGAALGKNQDNDKVCGYPDIPLHAKDGNVYVWEVTAEDDEQHAYKQVNLYIEKMRARGGQAERGWDLPMVPGVPVKRTGNKLFVYSAAGLTDPYSGGGPTGVILYDRTYGDREKQPEPKSVPQEVPVTEKIRDWLHDNLRMPEVDPSKPFTPFPAIPTMPFAPVF
ncbi:hypothetical protein [Streptomyces hygroscopicus]|uniref:hypothetical protein n=1 Tax=Streptomyces hygroscopicus TaxID=1912 RepID=UPI0036CCEF58